MSRSGRRRSGRTGLTASLTIGPTLLVTLLLLATGCERPTAAPTTDATSADTHQVPFHADPSGPDARPDGSQLPSGNSAAGLPFHDSQNLPAGTLLTVRLKYPIAAENTGSNGTFEAVMDEPVVIEGSSVVPRGASVAGRVESSQASNLRRNHGYVRLALDSIHLAGANLPVQTSSLFVKGNAASSSASQSEDQGAASPQHQPLAGVIRLEKGRRLTFRLTEPVYVAASQRTAADR